MELLGLALRGALGRLDEADKLDSVDFRRMTVAPRSVYGGTCMQIAGDGDRMWMRPPLVSSLAPQPLLLIQPREHQSPS